MVAALRDICFPPACLACALPLSHGGDLLFCPDCQSTLPTIQSPLCTLCGKPFPDSGNGDHHCGVCLASPWHFSRARAAVLYRQPVPALLHAFKFSGQTAGLQSLAQITRASAAFSHLGIPELILPVPLHARRLRQRGFNQSLLLARAIFADQIQKINPDILERTRATLPQVSLGGAARRKNLRGAFRVTKPELVTGKEILLVDDMFTTGTTVNECARVLRKAKALKVEVLTLARVKE